MSTISNKINVNPVWVPILLIAYNFIINLANDVYLPCMPTLAKVFNAHPNIVQLTVMSWYFGNAVPQLFLGPLSDRFGRRPILFLGGISFLVATLISMKVPNIESLIAARFIQGMGASSVLMVSYSIVTDLYHNKERIKILAYLTLYASLSPLVGPIIGSHILVWLGWQYNFLFIFLVTVINLSGLWYKLPESHLHKNLTALNLKYIFSSYLFLVKNNTYIGYLLVYCFLVGGMIAYLTGAPFVIIKQLNIRPEYFGYIQFFVFSAYIVGSLYLVYYGLRLHNVKHLLVAGLVMVLISALVMVLTSLMWSNSVIAFILPMLFYELGFGLCASPLINGVMSVALDRKGFSSALLGFSMACCGVIASSLTGLFYNGTLFSITAVIFLMSLLAALSFVFVKVKQSTIANDHPSAE